MAKNRYLPSSDAEKAIWLNNFMLKFASYSVQLGFTAAEAAALAADALCFHFSVDYASNVKTQSKEVSRFKDKLRDGLIGDLGPLPILPAVAAPPLVPAGVFKRVSVFVARVKASPNYNEGIGEEMGIIGTEQPFDPASLKPIINLTQITGGILLKWQKGDADALHIEADRGAGAGWVFLAVDTIPDYMDTHPLPPAGFSATWKYRCSYKINDEFVGEWSDVAIIAVR